MTYSVFSGTLNLAQSIHSDTLHSSHQFMIHNTGLVCGLLHCKQNIVAHPLILINSSLTSLLPYCFMMYSMTLRVIPSVSSTLMVG